jgi:hypothetical protein
VREWESKKCGASLQNCIKLGSDSAESVMCREKDQVTITEKADIQKALEELVLTADKLLGSSHSGRNTLQQMLPPLRLTLAPVESAEVRM